MNVSVAEAVLGLLVVGGAAYRVGELRQMKRDAAMMTRALSGGLGFSMPTPKAPEAAVADSDKTTPPPAPDAGIGAYL